jgi:hypothetical protein
MTNLDVLGKMNDFPNVFDIKYFRNNKKKAIEVIFISAINGRPADQNLVNLMNVTNYNTLIEYSYFSFVYRAKRLMKNLLKWYPYIFNPYEYATPSNDIFMKRP